MLPQTIYLAKIDFPNFLFDLVMNFANWSTLRLIKKVLFKRIDGKWEEKDQKKGERKKKVVNQASDSQGM